MSYLKIQTNQSISKKSGLKILGSASDLIAVELGKPKDLVMVALQSETEMFFGGSDAPTAFLEIKSVGVPKRKMKQLCHALTDLIHAHFPNIPENRVYLKIIDVRNGMWGWKGGSA